LQWIEDGKNIIYNIYDQKTMLTKAKIYDIENDKYSILDFPIDSVAPNHKYISSFNYSRLNKHMPGYGYNLSENIDTDTYYPDDTGIYAYDYTKNEEILYISLKQLFMANKSESMKNSWHFVTHTLFSPDSRYISFLHRWVKADKKKRWSRLIVVDLKTKEMFFSPTEDMVSHYVWNSKGNILAYCKINNIDSHILFNDYSMKKFQRIAYPTLNSDGHQTFSVNNSSYFITDTYPDRRRYSKLFSVDLNSNTVQLIAEIKSKKAFQTKDIYKHWGCDLHPRLSTDGKFVSFDSTHTGKRSFCIIKL
jgi:hypothetical protein